MPTPTSSSPDPPRLPLELQLEILRLSGRTVLFNAQADRRAHFGALSLVHSSWRRAAQTLLFDKLYFDLRRPEDDDETVDKRWAARMAGLRQLDLPTRRLVLFVDGTHGPTQRPAPMPWSVEVVERYMGVTNLEVYFDDPLSIEDGWTDPPFLALLPDLRSLALHGSSTRGMVDASHYLAATRLTRLVLSDISMVEWFPPSAFPHLKRLSLEQCNVHITLTQLRPLDNLFLFAPQLTHLRLDRITLTDAS
ncbi:hypothetical protein JCM10207_002433 [Rhodosporidiobolus poonsookiae]